jgi:hypothetical protein
MVIQHHNNDRHSLSFVNNGYIDSDFKIKNSLEVNQQAVEAFFNNKSMKLDMINYISVRKEY